MRVNLSVAIIVATTNALKLAAQDDPVELEGQGEVSAKPWNRSTSYAYEDKLWPEERCCRVYTLDSYDVKAHWGNTDWADFCAPDGDDSDVVFQLREHMKVYEGWGKDGTGVWWHNRVNSFKCGTHVAIEFCDEEKHCGKEKRAESAAGGSESQLMGKRNLASFIRLTPYDPDKRFAATVFDGDSCNGWSHVVWVDAGIDSGDQYSNVGHSLESLERDTIGSVMFPRGGDYWMDLWPEVQFSDGDCDHLSGWRNKFKKAACEKELRRRDSVHISSADATRNGCVKWEKEAGDIGVDSLRWGIGSKDEDCCRLYSDAGFKGSKETVCLARSQDYKEEVYAGDFEAASYICGSDVRPSFYVCETPFDNGSCESWSQAGSAMHGSAYNSHASPSGKLRVDRVSERAGATIYAQAGCAGPSRGLGEGAELSPGVAGWPDWLAVDGAYSAWVPLRGELILQTEEEGGFWLKGEGQCIEIEFPEASTYASFDYL